MSLTHYLENAAAILVQTIQSDIAEQVDKAIDVIVTALQSGKTLLVCGNGGSAGDSAHITAELVGRFYKMERPALRCINLAADPAILTAWPNDYSFDTVFARQVEAYGGKDSVLLGLSTSGNSRNVITAFEKAWSMGMKTIAMTGTGGGNLKSFADVLIAAPSSVTYEIQQVHICLYHYMCAQIEERVR